MLSLGALGKRFLPEGAHLTREEMPKHVVSPGIPGGAGGAARDMAWGSDPEVTLALSLLSFRGYLRKCSGVS